MGCVESQPLPGCPRRRQTSSPAAPVELNGPVFMLTTSAALVLLVGVKVGEFKLKPMHAAVAVLLAMEGAGLLTGALTPMSSNAQFATVSKETPWMATLSSVQSPLLALL